MTTIRKFTFGKYKGEPILKVIAEHIGYIMWCFENVRGFKLTPDEQKFYDWQAIAIKKYGIQMIFPVDLMYKHVSNKEALDRLETPYVYIKGDGFIPKDCSIYNLLVQAGAIKTEIQTTPMDFNGVIRGLRHSMIKELDNMDEDELNEMNREFGDDINFLLHYPC